MVNKLSLFVTLAVFVMCASAFAVPDPGIPDTVRIESVSIPSGSTESFAVEVFVYNDEELGGIVIPVKWNSPDISCDSITFEGSRIEYVGMKPTSIDNANTKLLSGMAIIMETYLQPGSGNIYTAWFSAASGAPDQEIILDSNQYSVPSYLYFVLADGNTIDPQFVQGKITIGSPVSQPEITLDPVTLDFSAVQDGSNPAAQSFDISNTGAGTLEWTASADSWITLDPTSGTGPGTVNASVNIAGLTAGTHDGTITVSDPNATNTPQEIAVTLILDPPPPCLSLSSATVNFSGLLDDIQTTNINISNCGGGDLNWTVSGIDEAWLSISPTSGINSGLVEFTADMTGLAPGTYSDVVSFAGGSGTDNSPQDVTVSLTIIDDTPDADTVWVANVSTNAGEQVVVDIEYQNFIEIGSISLPLWFTGTGLLCDSVSFVGSRIEYMAEHIGNIDNDAATIKIEGVPVSQPYLQSSKGLLAKLYFSIDPAAITQVSSIDSAHIPPDVDYLFTEPNGTGRATEFYSGGISITGLPCFAFPADTVFFNAELGTVPALQTFEIANSCYGSMTWSLTDDAAWLSAVPASGMQGDFVEISVNPAGMPEGVHGAILTFASNAINSPFEVPVKLDYYGVPELALSTTSINFGSTCRGTTANDEFTISNTGTGVMPWTITSGSEVTLSSTSGSGSATITFEVATDGMDFGPQSTTIIVDAGDAASSPQTITLSFNIANCDECAIDIAEANGPQGLPVAVPIYAFQISDVAGLELHMAYENTILAADSVTSDYMTGAIVGLMNDIYGTGYIHYVWDNFSTPLAVPDGEVMMTVWLTSIGTVGESSAIWWLEGNELVDTLGNPDLSLGFCDGSVTIIEPIFEIGGQVVYYGGSTPIEGVDIDLAGVSSASTVTDASGNYSFADLEIGGYTVTPSRTDDDGGVSIADVIKIRRHLAYVERFSTGYQMIAADVNVTNTVSISDVVTIRRYLAVLGPLPAGNWTFIDSDYALDTDNWPMAPRSKIISIVNEDLVIPDLIGIRLGDVNATWATTPMAAKSIFALADPVKLEIGESSGQIGDLVTVPINLSNMDELAGIELHLAYNTAELSYLGIKSDVLSGALINGTEDNIHIVWENFEAPLSVNGSQPLAELTFRVSGSFDNMAEIAVTGAELVDTEGLAYPLSIQGGILYEGQALSGTYSLEQNTPNPFNPSTTIMATMMEAGEYSLEIFNIVGQRIKTFYGYGQAGTIEFVWDGTDDNGQAVASGIFLYKFNAGEFNQTKKMMLLK